MGAVSERTTNVTDCNDDEGDELNFADLVNLRYLAADYAVRLGAAAYEEICNLRAATPAEGWPATVAALWAESDRLLTRAQAAEAEAERQRARAEAAEGEAKRLLDAEADRFMNPPDEVGTLRAELTAAEVERDAWRMHALNHAATIETLHERLAAAEARAAAAEAELAMLRHVYDRVIGHRDALLTVARTARECVTRALADDDLTGIGELDAALSKLPPVIRGAIDYRAALPPQPAPTDAPADDGATAPSKAEIKDFHMWDGPLTPARVARVSSEIAAGTRTPDNCDCLVCKRKRAGGGNEEADAMREQGGTA